MKETIVLEIAKKTDIEGILALQELYLVSNLSEIEKEQGFVTTPFSIEQLIEIITNKGLFIAKDQNKIIAYLFSGSWNFYSQWPIFSYMITLFPDLNFLDSKITTSNSFQYGPICIDKEYRGKGLIEPFFEFMRVNMAEKFPLGVTFINKTNIPSTKAHTEKLNWTIISDFEFNNNKYHILAYDMQKPV